MLLKNIRAYIEMGRPGHWVKHIFIVPGVILAWKLGPETQGLPISGMIIGLLSAFALSSANYVLNEWLDAESDRFHPEKQNRPAARGLVRPLEALALYVVLTTVGMFLATLVNQNFLIVSLVFALAAITYNVRPMRFKDVAYLDVAIEALNNPIRLMLGWTMVSDQPFAPLSALALFWFSGGYLMSAKRLAEFRSMAAIGELENLKRYRVGFNKYSEISLIVGTFVYGIAASFNIAVFLIKYRVEYLLSFPLVVALFAYYLVLTLRPGSVVQTPECLYRNPWLILLVASATIALVLLTVVDLELIVKYFG